MTINDFILFAWFFVMGWTFGRISLKERLQEDFQKKLKEEERRAGENFNIGFQIGQDNCIHTIESLLAEKGVPQRSRLHFFNALTAKIKNNGTGKNSY